MVTSERSIQGEGNTKLAFDEMHGSTPQVLLVCEAQGARCPYPLTNYPDPCPTEWIPALTRDSREKHEWRGWKCSSALSLWGHPSVSSLLDSAWLLRFPLQSHSSRDWDLVCDLHPSCSPCCSCCPALGYWRTWQDLGQRWQSWHGSWRESLQYREWVCK